MVCGRGRKRTAHTEGLHLSRYRLLSALVVPAWVGLAACFEHAPRSGPLARMADSLAPARALKNCYSPSMRLPRQPRHHICVYAAPDTVLVTVGVTGRVFSVVRNLPGNPETLGLLDSTGGPLVSTFGKPDYAGSDTHGGVEFHWRSDTLCVGLFYPRGEPYLQLAFVLPEFYGRCG